MTAPGDAPPTAPRGPLRWCFEDRTNGRLVVVQWPNLPMWIFLVGLATQLVLNPAGKLGTAVLVVTAVGLTWWAVDEVIRGCNPWRRALGVAVLAFQVYHFWPMLTGWLGRP